MYFLVKKKTLKKANYTRHKLSFTSFFNKSKYTSHNNDPCISKCMFCILGFFSSVTLLPISSYFHVHYKNGFTKLFSVNTKYLK